MSRQRSDNQKEMEAEEEMNTTRRNALAFTPPWPRRSGGTRRRLPGSCCGWRCGWISEACHVIRPITTNVGRGGDHGRAE